MFAQTCVVGIAFGLGWLQAPISTPNPLSLIAALVYIKSMSKSFLIVRLFINLFFKHMGFYSFICWNE